MVEQKKPQSKELSGFFLVCYVQRAAITVSMSSLLQTLVGYRLVVCKVIAA